MFSGKSQPGYMFLGCEHRMHLWTLRPTPVEFLSDNSGRIMHKSVEITLKSSGIVSSDLACSIRMLGLFVCIHIDRKIRPKILSVWVWLIQADAKIHCFVANTSESVHLHPSTTGLRGQGKPKDVPDVDEKWKTHTHFGCQRWCGEVKWFHK